MSSDLAVRLDGLGKAYWIGHQQGDHVTLAEAALVRLRHPLRRSEREEIWALRHASLEVRAGEVVGLVGRNGAGKSTLLRLLSRVTAPTEGRIELWGRVGSLLEVGTGFHPELTGRENIHLNGAILGMRRQDIVRRFDEIVEFAGVERFLDTPVKRYSSGMYVRLAFAVAAHLDSEILLVDEVLAVGDAEFQQRCLGRIRSVASEGTTVVLVSHNLAVVSQVAPRTIFLAAGEVAAYGPTDEVIETVRRSGGYLGSGDEVYVPTDDDRWNPRGLSRDVEIVGIRMLDANPALPAGADVRVLVHLRGVRDAPAFRAHLGLLTADGAGVGAAFSAEELAVRAGEQVEVVVNMPEPHLAPGSYLIEVSVGRGDHFGTLDHFDVVTHVLPFEAAPPVSAAGRVAMGWNPGWGPILIPALRIESVTPTTTSGGVGVGG